MTRNQLPEGVGKKIVEALKKQAEADITPVVNDININNNKSIISESEADTGKNTGFETLSNTSNSNENFIIEDDTDNAVAFDIKSLKEDSSFITPVKEVIADMPVFKTNSEMNNTMQYNNSSAQTFNMNSAVTSSSSSYSGIPLSEESAKPVTGNVIINIPTNVAVLRNLVSSLPSGVSKQIGAQIIRQTLEAMGLPMTSVLKEAQTLQEELNTNTRECMLKIQEFKTNIMSLEQSVQEYQKNITQINDLISLFLLTDRK